MKSQLSPVIKKGNLKSPIPLFPRYPVVLFFGRILGYFSQGPTFFVREILDGIAAQPGGDYIHGGYRHRQVVPQSRLKYHGLPGPPLVRADNESWIFWDEIFRASNFFREFQFKNLITETIQVPRLKHPGNWDPSLRIGLSVWGLDRFVQAWNIITLGRPRSGSAFERAD